MKFVWESWENIDKNGKKRGEEEFNICLKVWERESEREKNNKETRGKKKLMRKSREDARIIKMIVFGFKFGQAYFIRVGFVARGIFKIRCKIDRE